jgi:hypothetical protein
VGFEKPDALGPPVKISNTADLAAEPPDAVVYVPAPPGYSHNAPDTSVPYATGPESLPHQEKDRE